MTRGKHNNLREVWRVSVYVILFFSSKVLSTVKLEFLSIILTFCATLLQFASFIYKYKPLFVEFHFLLSKLLF